MLRKFILVRNVDTIEHTIIDRRFSHGKLALAPGEEYGLPNDIWMDHRRRHGGWLKDVSVIDAPIEAALAEAETPVAKEVTMAELRERAKELGVTIPVGTTKLEAASLIEAALAEADASEKGNDDENTI